MTDWQHCADLRGGGEGGGGGNGALCVVTVRIVASFGFWVS